MGLVRAAARVARGWHQDRSRRPAGGRWPPLSELVAPFAPQRLAAFRAEGHRLVLSTTTPADMIAPFAEAIGFDDLIATAYETKDGRYTGRLYEGSSGGPASCAPCGDWADDRSDRPGRLPRLQRQHLRRAAALERGHAARGEPGPVADGRGHGPALGGRALGPAARASRASSGSSRTTCCGRSSASSRSPTPASTSRASSTCRHAGRCCWPPTTGATSTWRRWRWWRGRSGGRCASSARRRSSTPPSSARSPAPSAASPSTGAAARASRSAPPRPR